MKETVYKIKKLCYSLIRGAVMPKENDSFYGGPMGVLVQGFLMTLVLIMATLVLHLTGGSIEGEIKEVMESLMEIFRGSP